MSAARAVDRLRALSLMGVDVYVRRVRGQAATSVGEPAPRVTEAPLPAAAPARDGRGTRLVFATADAGGFDGPHATLLRHLALALGLGPAGVACGEPREDLPCVCFGAAPGSATDVVLAPPLATLRASAAARRALWPQLRSLARRLRS
jgi:hypothetical protein